MKKDSNVEMIAVKTAQGKEGSCGGAVEQKKRNYRRLRSKETGKIIHQKKEKSKVKKVFDPTAWYVVQTKRYKEVSSCDFLSSSKGFVNDSTKEPYNVEAYAAVQEDEGNRLVIHGKIFIRVEEINRIDVLRKCPYLKGYVKGTGTVTKADGTTEVYEDKTIMSIGVVSYSDNMEAGNYRVVKTDGSQLSFTHSADVIGPTGVEKNYLLDAEGNYYTKNSTLTDMQIQISKNNFLDKLGVFKFTLPVSQLRKM